MDKLDKKRDTVGSLSSDLISKEMPTRDPIELQREIHKDFEKHFYECIGRGKRCNEGDFYVVVTTKKERLMQNVIRNYFGFRSTCPTPEWDQAVYKYNGACDDKSESVDFLWVVPSKDSCELLKDNALLVDKSERELLKYVLDFNDGTLLSLAKKLNSEV